MANLSDDISSLLHTLLHNSSQASTSSAQTHHPETRQPGSTAFSEPVGMFEPGFGFSGGYYSSGAAGSMGLSLEEINEADCESEGQEDARLNAAPGRGSSKRSRAAEVHNLSEKRRRQKINERMKALQKLIPNSNKTDKASMLDEAIEYLKQLQLQVQMLTMRNGTVHPYYLPGPAQSLQQPPVASLLGEANNNRGMGSFSAEQDASVQPMFDLASKPDPYDYKQLMPGASASDNLGAPIFLEPSMAHRPYDASMSSKVLRKEQSLPQLPLDMSHCGQSSSSGVSLYLPRWLPSAY